ncbi:MAG TPA: HEAT repeat domain-containing protein [Rhodanobacteraceae bacterium]|nr:HEAT repeat domain-containing protein [Rhodanobacteraceae bacterium]
MSAASVLCSCNAVAAAGDHETGLAAQFKTAAPAERAKLASNLSYRNDTPAMVAALVPFLKSSDAELRADTAYVLRGFYSRALEQAVPALLPALNGDPAWRVRANAAYALMTIPEGAGTLTAFGKCTTDRDERVRAACAKGLGTIAKAQHAGGSHVISLLATDLGDDSRLVRYGAATAFAELASTEPAAIHALAARLDVEPDPWVRGAIARAIAASGPAAEPALPALTRAVLDPLPLYTANQVIAAMAAIGAPAVPTLIATLGYRTPAARYSTRAANAAKTSLVKLKVPMTAPLIVALQRGPAQQRTFAADVLGEKGAEATAAIPALTSALKDDDTGVRRAAAKSLGQLTAYDGAALSALLGALDDPEADVREAAVNALDDGLDGAFVSNERAVAASRADKPVPKPLDVLPPSLVAQTARALGARLGDSDVAVAGIAAQALGKMGPQAAPALGALKTALLAPHGDHARDAADALAAMGSIGAPLLIEAVRTGASPANRSAIGIRGRAAAGLATLGWNKQLGDHTAAAVAALIDGLSDPRSDVRGDVAEALGNLGHAGGDVTSMKGTVVAALKDAMAREQDDNAKQSMQLAMRNWGVGS